jgi:deoxyribodipyrimidine photo-lyase
MPAVMWFRRDLRLSDNPALLDAAAGDGEVLPLFVVDPALWGPAGPSRRHYLAASLRDLDTRVGLTVRTGDPVREVVRAAREVDADRVHIAADYGPYGRVRDELVDAALAEHGIELVRTGSPYAVAPGRVTKGDGTPYQVYTPYFRAWTQHGWRDPAGDLGPVGWLTADSDGPPTEPLPAGLALPEAGEAAAHRRWRDYRREKLEAYDRQRDRPDLDATSHMSVHLRWGEIHPRTLLADLAGTPGLPSDDVATFRSELAWREFHADVLHHRPGARSRSLRAVVPEDAWAQDDAEAELLDAWREGRTGYPLVDAGMRQLLATGWMHNRVRMVVASFLVKDLHVRWQRGAEHFMAHLVDGDVSQNQLNWQWVAGTGYDAAPYFRVFNPVTQAKKFDPDGDYVRRWVPELRDVDGPRAHEPWRLDPPPPGYPARLVDHATERKVALDDFHRARTSR